MVTPERTGNAVPGALPAIRYINDFERCSDPNELVHTMEVINRNQYLLISVTQDSKNIFTVFFRRCVVG